MNKITGFCFVLLLSAAGLTLGADVYSEGSVSVVLPANPAGQAMNVPGVFAAIQTAGAVLAPAGFVYGHNGTGNTNTPDRIAVFIRNNSVGNPTACNVLLRDNRAVFSFLDTGISNSSPATVQLCNQLATALGARFGAAAVEVHLK